MASSRSSVARAALGGLLLGLLGATLLCAFGAWRSTLTECEFPGTEECAMELTMANDMARPQLYAAVGCALVSAGLYVALRRPSKNREQGPRAH